MLAAVGPSAKVDTQARFEGRSMTMVLSPDKQAQEAMRKAALEAEREAAAGEVSDEECESKRTGSRTISVHTLAMKLKAIEEAESRLSIQGFRRFMGRYQ